MNRTYIRLLAATVIALLSVTSVGLLNPVYAASPASAILPAGSISTHGPLINSLVLEVESDSQSFLNVQSGSVPAMEWSLSLAQYASAEANPSLYTNSTLSYTFDGIAFNFLQAPYNNTHFREAIAYLMDYATIQNNLGPTIQAGNEIYNANLFPLYNTGVVTNPYSYNATAAMQQLAMVPGMTYTNSTGWMYNGKPFSPQIYSRADDMVVREPITQLLVKDAAADINLTITNNGIPGSQAGTFVYGPAASAVIKPAVMNPTTYHDISGPVFNYTYAKTSDTWGMYTFGWIVSFNPTYTWAFFNAQLAGVVDFIDYYSPNMDYYTNLLNYANSSTAAQNAAVNILTQYYTDLPYVVFGWQSSLFAVNPSSGSGWTGFTNLPTLGPSESTGLYYTALNVHPAGAASGGTFTETLHQVPTSLDPLFVTNWIWQIDVWQFVYDMPLGTPPTAAGILDGQTMPWMANVAVSNNNSTSIGNATGWYNPFHAKGIVNGQVFTINFYQNDTWSDGVPLTAYDYNASLYLENVQGNAPTSTPFAGTSAPPLGLLATYIPPNNPYQIQLFVNSTTVWNIYAINDPVLPWHIFKFFNPSLIATSSAAMDTTVPFAKGSYNTYLASGYTSSSPSLQFLNWLPNLEVGSGAFDFQSWNTVSNVINLTANPMWQRADPAIHSASISSPAAGPYSYSTTISTEIYNPTSSTYSGIAPGTTGNLAITNATGNVLVLNQNGTVLETAPLGSGSSGGVYTASIPTSSLSQNTAYELELNATYTLGGLTRVAHAYSQLVVGQVSSSSSTTTTAPTSTTTTSTSGGISTTTLGIIAAVIVVIIVATAVVLFMRRRPAT